jgi:uncharacterized membrane protein YgaE (UPF0421/DUF939 family)
MYSSQAHLDENKSDQDGPDKEEEVEIVEGNEAQETSDVSSMMDLVEDKVRILDEEFTNLSKLEQTLKDLLHLLQSEEETLRIALSQASETLIAKRARQRKERETEAISRLEAALGLDTDSNDTNNN